MEVGDGGSGGAERRAFGGKEEEVCSVEGAELSQRELLPTDRQSTESSLTDYRLEQKCYHGDPPLTSHPPIW